MATVQTMPGQLGIRVKSGDGLDHLLDFSIDLTGYTFAAEIVSAITGATVLEPAVAEVDLAAGQVRLVVLGDQCAAIAPGSYLWRLVWTPTAGERRTALEGIFEVAR